jgi:hypothetical protein
MMGVPWEQLESSNSSLGKQVSWATAVDVFDMLMCVLGCASRTAEEQQQRIGPAGGSNSSSMSATLE